MDSRHHPFVPLISIYCNNKIFFKKRTNCTFFLFIFIVTDLRTNETLIYNSIRKAAEALNTDYKSLRYNENKQKERGTIVPFKKYFIITINRD